MPNLLEYLLPGDLNFKARSMGKWSALTDAATIAVDASLSDSFTVTLGGNRTLGNPTNAPIAANSQMRFLRFRIRQDGTGSRTLAYGTDYRFPSAVTPVLTTTAGETDYLTFLYHETDLKWDLVGSIFDLRN